MATCPECDAEVEVDEFDVEKGDPVSCAECGSNLVIAGLSPIELDLADDEDDEDEDDDDEEKEGEEDAELDGEEEDGDAEEAEDWDE